MELFRDDGHLTDEALNALTREDDLPELCRLEISEHLGYCNDCLERYAALMTEEKLLSPGHSCGGGLWHRIRSRSAHAVFSRHAAAAAAVIMTLTALWGSLGFSAVQQPRTKAAPPAAIVNQEPISRAKQHAGHWNAVNKKKFTKLDKIWNLLEANTPAKIKGGYKR